MKIRNFILPLLFTGFTAIGAHAQRSCNMAVTLISPAEGAVIPAFAQFNVTVNIVNNGPADLIQGDTVWYHTPLMFEFSRTPFVLTQGIAMGQARTVTLTTITNVEGSSSDEQKSFCVEVESSPTNDGAYKDPDFTDNRDCNMITQKATPTAIGDVNKNGKIKLNLSPNPSTGLVKMSFTTDKQINARLSVKDLSGREVLAKDMGKVNQGNAELSVDVASLVPGLYILELQGDGKRAIGKLVKQ